MSNITTPTTVEGVQVTPLDRFASYSFAADADYQQGLSGIVNGGGLEGKSDEEREELLLRSEVFYFNRIHGTSIGLDEARAVRQNGGSVDTSTAQEPPTLTFAQLKELIEQGRTDEIPNNKTIPNVLSADAPSESKAIARKKPWEVNVTA